ncbi:MAG: hypothetical protein Q7U89_07115 [Coriobacteriia bacterium]|nr:hypothetical protein [Coriobacteriia bacterium]
MVPREPNRTATASDPKTLLFRLFNAWRKLLAAARGGAPVAGPRLILAVGLGATIAGATIAQIIHPAQQPLQGLAAGAVSVMWVVARLVMMLLSNTSETTSEPGTIRSAWAVGALPQLFAVTPELKIVAWFLGAALSFRALVATGTAPRDALRLSALGYVVEPAGFVLVALMRNLTSAFQMLA